MFEKFLAVICVISCIYPLKSSAMPSRCHGSLISINSLEISREAKTALLNAGLSIRRLSLYTEEELLERFNIDRVSLQEAKDALSSMDSSRVFREILKTAENVFKSLGLSIRTARRLIREDITSIEELTAHTAEELRRKFDIGPVSVQEIEEVLKTQGLSLSDGRDLNSPGFSSFDRFKQLGLSTKPARKLIRENITSIEKLTTKTREELLRTFDIGPVSVQEIEEVLEAQGLALSDGKDLNAPGLSPFDQFKRLGLSTKTARKLIGENILSVEKLSELTERELRELFDIGPVSVQEIKTALQEHDLALTSDEYLVTPSWIPSSGVYSEFPTYGTGISQNPEMGMSSGKK